MFMRRNHGLTVVVSEGVHGGGGEVRPAAVACGGGHKADESAALGAAAVAADAAGDNPRRHALADNTPLSPTQPASPANVEPLLGWAERVYADLFPAGPATQLLTHEGQTYSLRYYARTGNYVGVALDGGVWGYGPFTNNLLRGFGHVNDYRCLVSPASCVPVAPSCETEVDTGVAGDLNAGYELAGGGGTDFECVFNYLKDNDIEPKRPVMFTDGYPFGSWGDENYADTVWIIHGNPSPDPPFGVWAKYGDTD